MKVHMSLVLKIDFSNEIGLDNLNIKTDLRNELNFNLVISINPKIKFQTRNSENKTLIPKK